MLLFDFLQSQIWSSATEIHAYYVNKYTCFYHIAFTKVCLLHICKVKAVSKSIYFPRARRILNIL